MIACEDALERLIEQFSQPLAFLRELIQNSLDAATELVEVTVDYDPSAACCFVQVSDTGDGMDREVIDTKLTRLFSSTKEDDLTKIGKFGIGFVSVFAIKPKLVVLDTGRGGEYWRVLFQPDRSFERRELETPVEGTTVKVFTPMSRKDLCKLQEDCRETIVYWCKHSEVEITFNGEPINQAFELPDVPFQYHFKTEATEAVMTPSREEYPFCGFYNRGLTLLEGSGSPIPKVALKVRSTHLEHTLTRDNIIQDAAYTKLIQELAKKAHTAMVEELFKRLSREDNEDLWRLAWVAVTYPGQPTRAIRKLPIWPGWDRRYTTSELDGVVFHCGQPCELWREVVAAGHKVISSPSPNHPKMTLLLTLGFKHQPLEKSFVRYAVQDPEEKDMQFLAALGELTRAISRRPPVLVDFLDAPESWSNRLSAMLDPSQRLFAVAAEPKGRRVTLALVRNGPRWRELLELYAHSPEVALGLACSLVNVELRGSLNFKERTLGPLLSALQRTEAHK